MKRTISLILALFMLCGLIPFSMLTVSATGDTVISVENVSATVNSTVDVAISISGNTGIASMGIILTFDSSLVLVGAQNGEAFSELTMTPPSQLKNGGSVTGSCRFAWLGTDNVTDDGVILNLKFRVSDDAQLNKDCTVSVVCENAFDEGRNSVTVSTVDGAVKVIDYIPGDVDGNGVINMLDVLTLCQYYVDAEGYGVNINPLAGDVDANGMVNMLDVLMVCQYYVDAEGYNVTLLPGKVSCNHELQNVPAKDATCTEEGNIAYFACTKCGKYFSDAEGKTEITAKETVIAAKGHTEVLDDNVKPGYSQGTHCSECGMVIKESVSQAPNEYSITYLNLGDAENPNAESFTENDLPMVLASPTRKGYDFIGWYDENDNKVTMIKSVTEKNVVLVAKWSEKEYTVTLDYGYGDKRNVTYRTFTVNDEFDLPTPDKPKYVFDGWMQGGIRKTKVEKGTAENLTFMATWRSSTYEGHKFSELPNPRYDRVTYCYNAEHNTHSFIYYLGYISNVPTNVQYDKVISFEGVGHQVTKEFGKTEEDTTRTEVTKSTTNTRKWENEVSASYSSSISAEVGIKLNDLLSVGGSRSSTWTVSAKGTVGETESDTVSKTDIDEYTTKISEITETTYTFSSDDLSYGFYRPVIYTIVDVFAVVEYDAKTNAYTVYTHESPRLDNASAGWEYSYNQSFEERYKYPTLDFEVELSDAKLPLEVEEYVRSIGCGTTGLRFQKSGNVATVTGYTGGDTDIVIPEFYREDEASYLVTGIDSNVFKNSTNITSVSVGSGITDLKASQFEGCSSLKKLVTRGKVNFGSKLTVDETLPELIGIGANAFKGCINLKFDIPESVKTIGDNAFEECVSIVGLHVSKNVESLGTNILKGVSGATLKIEAYDFAVAKNAANSCAGMIILQLPENLEAQKTTIEVGSETSSFTVIGRVDENNQLSSYKNLHIVSHANSSIFNTLSIKNSSVSETAIEVFSDHVVLNRVTIEALNSAIVFSGESVDVAIDNEVSIASGNGDAFVASKDIVIHNLKETSSGTLRVTGGRGNPGGHAIVAVGNLSIQGYVNIEATGGVGNKGAKGYTPGKSGNGDGGTGEKGSNGGVGIEAANVTIGDNAVVIARGGVGGTGGTGGNSVNKYWNSKNSGGTGGSGGVGGVGLSTQILNISSAASVSVYGGNGGVGGKGGYKDTRYYSGSNGSGGSGGYGSIASWVGTEMTGVFAVCENGSDGQSGAKGGTWDSQDDYDGQYWD